MPAPPPPRELSLLTAWNSRLKVSGDTATVTIPASDLLFLLNSHWKLRCDIAENETIHSKLSRRAHIYEVMVRKMGDIMKKEVRHSNFHIEHIKKLATLEAREKFPRAVGSFEEDFEVEWLAKAFKCHIPRTSATRNNVQATETISNRNIDANIHRPIEVPQSESSVSVLRDDQLTTKELTKRHRRMIRDLNYVSKTLEKWTPFAIEQYIDWRFYNNESYSTSAMEVDRAIERGGYNPVPDNRDASVPQLESRVTRSKNANMFDVQKKLVHTALTKVLKENEMALLQAKPSKPKSCINLQSKISVSNATPLVTDGDKVATEITRTELTNYATSSGRSTGNHPESTISTCDTDSGNCGVFLGNLPPGLTMSGLSGIVRGGRVQYIQLYNKRPAAKFSTAVVCFSSAGEASRYVNWTRKYPIFINHHCVRVHTSDTRRPAPRSLGMESTRVLVVAPGFTREKLSEEKVAALIDRSKYRFDIEIESYTPASNGTTTIVFSSVRLSYDVRKALIANGWRANFGKDQCAEPLSAHRWFSFDGSKLEKSGRYASAFIGVVGQ